MNEKFTFVKSIILHIPDLLSVAYKITQSVQEGLKYLQLYFTGFDKAGDIFRAGYSEGKYQEAENVGAPINTEKNELHPLIASDESWIIYDPWDESYGPYISFRLSDGSWTNPMRMDEKLQMRCKDHRGS